MECRNSCQCMMCPATKLQTLGVGVVTALKVKKTKHLLLVFDSRLKHWPQSKKVFGTGCCLADCGSHLGVYL